MTTETSSISPTLVEEQLRRIQSSPLFSHSRRYPSFLDYVVRKTLEGHQDELKERTVGVEAFGRPASYDLNSDPIVRVTAGEVRKRLAQYYYQPSHHDELRIELHPGSYVPEFRYESKPAAVPESVLTLEVVEPEFQAPAPAVLPSATAHSHKGLWTLGVVLLGSLTLGAFAWTNWRPTSVEQFWRPVLDNRSPVLITVGSVVAMVKPDDTGDDAASVGGHPLASDPIALSDAVAISTIERVLSSHGRSAAIQSSSNTTFLDLQKGPVVLISGFDNAWTMRLTDPLRFHLVRVNTDDFAIVDRNDASRSWTVDTHTKFTSSTKDYGLVARYFDPTTEQLAIVAAGIGENGTVAASQLLSDERFLSQLNQQGKMPARGQNFEAVIETQIIDGKPGPPRILATHVW